MCPSPARVLLMSPSSAFKRKQSIDFPSSIKNKLRRRRKWQSVIRVRSSAGKQQALDGKSQGQGHSCRARWPYHHVDVCRRYDLTREEFLGWCAAIDHYGIKVLLPTQVQQDRNS